jgi:hypothetical protein
MRSRVAGLLLAASLTAGAVPPVAFVADIRGNATIEGDGKLSFLAELPAGTRLLLGTNAAASIAYAASGAEFTIVGPGRFMVGIDDVTAENGAKPARRAVAALQNPAIVAKASLAATASLRMRGVAPPQPPASPLQFPVSTSVATLKPAMRWQPTPGEEYTLVVLDASGGEVWKAGKARPEGTRPSVALSAGTRYSWRVMGSGKALGEAQFETLSPEAIARAEKSRLGARTFADRVRLALTLQDIGAEQEAREVWDALARERPDLQELSALAR